MKVNYDIGKLILKILHGTKNAIDIEYLAYLTGSTVTQVIEEGKKLQELELIEMTDSKIKLISNENQKFSNWDRLKK